MLQAISCERVEQAFICVNKTASWLIRDLSRGARYPALFGAPDLLVFVRRLHSY